MTEKEIIFWCLSTKQCETKKGNEKVTCQDNILTANLFSKTV